jgi:hypothetical protein
MTTHNLQDLTRDDLDTVEGGLCYNSSRQCVVEWVNDIGLALFFGLAAAPLFA